MKEILELLAENASVSDYKINIHQKESYELFFVKGALETVRCTDTTDREVTVYADHGEFKGDAQFFVYASTTEQQLKERIEEAVAKALGCGLFGLRPNRIRIGHTDGGQPVVTIEAAEDRFPPLTFFLSVTHTRHTAQAVAVAEYRKEGAVCGR